MQDEQKVKALMRELLEGHIDPKTDEVNTTALAEHACYELDAYGPAPKYKIPEDYFDWALEVDEEEISCDGCGNQGSSALFGHLPPGSGLNLCRDVCLAGRR